MMPPPIPPGGNLAPPPTGGTSNPPAAHNRMRTRSKIPTPTNGGAGGVGGGGAHAPPPSRSIGAFANAARDPPASMAPPIRMAPSNMAASSSIMAPPPSSTAAAAGSNSLSAGVDDAIAKRRAELRRLQQNRGAGISGAMSQNRGGGAAALASARSRLGTGIGAAGIGSSRPGGRGVAALAALSTPSGSAGGMVGTTPSTAAITRRLDPALATAANVGPPKPRSIRQQPPQQSQPPQSLQPTKTVAQQQPPKPAALTGNMKRTSEIFNVGREYQKQSPATTTKPAPTTALNPFSPSGPTRPQPPVQSMPQQAAPKISPPKSPRSPFGQPRAVAKPVIAPGKPPLIMPSLVAEPPVVTVAMPKQQPVVAVPKQPTMGMMTSSQRNQKPMAKKMESNKTALAAKKAEPAKALRSTNNVKAEDISSGKSTPVMSNVHELKKSDGGATALLKKEDPVKKVVPSNDGSSAPPKTSNMSSLMNDLQRTEQEKKDALEQVNKLKSTLEQYEKQKQTGQQQTSPSTSDNIPGGLLDQLKGMVSSQGESAAVAWIAQQLEAAKDDGNSPLSPSNNRGRSRGEPHGRVMGEDNLLSSVLPPLTPRSRPGSRAASPERGGGGGLLMSQSLGQAMDKLGGGDGPARGKRMMTPMPKQLNKNATNGYGREQVAGLAEETLEREYLVATAESIPNEYGTQLASYFVRQPYIGSDESENDSNNNKWTAYSHLSSEVQYQQRATTFDPNSLEIIACIDADGSVFTLSGRSDARHGKVSNSSLCEEQQQMDASAIVASQGENVLDWAVFDEVEEMDCALGRVTYIDVEGNEREYWLDSIYEEALATRESYSMSMISAAFVLKNCSSMQQPPMQTSSPMLQPIQQNNAPPPAQFMNATSGSAPMQHQPSPMHPSQPTMVESPLMHQSNIGQPAPMMPTVQPAMPNLQEPKETSRPAMQSGKPPLKPKTNLPPSSEKMQLAPSKSEKKEQLTTAKQLPEEEGFEEPADSALAHMVISLFSLLFSMVWFFAKIPFKIGSVLFTFWVVLVFLKIAWLFLADDNDAWEMGAGVDYEYNMPGIY